MNMMNSLNIQSYGSTMGYGMLVPYSYMSASVGWSGVREYVQADWQRRARQFETREGLAAFTAATAQQMTSGAMNG